MEFGEASSNRSPDGPFDILFVEGSISTQEQIHHLRHLRERSELLVTIGACATSPVASRRCARGPATMAASRASSTRSMPTRNSWIRSRRASAGGGPRDRRCRAAWLPHRHRAAARAAHGGLHRPPTAAAQRGGLRRLQARWAGVRDGLARRALPGPHHRDRLQRALSRAWPAAATAASALARAPTA